MRAAVALAAAQLAGIRPAAGCTNVTDDKKDISPTAAAALVAGAIARYTDPASKDGFATWSYGCGIIMDAMLRAAKAQPAGGAAWGALASAKLDAWLADTSSNAYKVAHGETVPWGRSIGDNIGLYPIAYLARAELGLGSNATLDRYIADQVAQRYILGWQERWTDGTISRSVVGSWPGEKSDATNASIVWGDDAFMGLTLAARLAAADPTAPAAGRYRDFVAEQQPLFRARLEGPGGLYYHAQNAADGHYSCCLWSRANGWTLMSHVEALAALDPAGHPGAAAALDALRAHAAAFKAAQDTDDGRVHQLMNDSSSFHETSGTAMYIYSVGTAVLRGWLPRADYDASLRLAWDGLTRAIQHDGEVTGICNGFGIHADAAAYEAAGCDYTHSSPGLGSVLRATLTMADYLAAA